MTTARTPPADIRRKLRQEAFFGCAACGCPILDYHHIIPWRDEEHFDLDHMVALCPTHHREYGKRRPEDSYKLKRNPFNRSQSALKGFLSSDRDHVALIAGSNLYEHCHTIIDYCGVEIISCSIVDGQAVLSAYIPDGRFFPELLIEENDMTAGVNEFWDIDFRTNYVCFRRKARDIFFELDLREECINFRCKLLLNGVMLDVSPSGILVGRTDLPNMLRRSKYSNLPTVFHVKNPDGMVFSLPNYAMREPMGRHISTGRSHLKHCAVALPHIVG